jgi:uncharacterized cupin superfamily protein
MAPPEKPAPRVLVRAGERGPAFPSSHPYNPRSEMHGWLLSRPAGLARIAVNLVRIPAGRESAMLHVHHREEEWLFVLAGRGVAQVDDREHEIGQGDFLGFPPGVAHHLRATEELHVLVGGEIFGDVEVADFPSLRRRLVMAGGRFAVYPLDAEVPFLSTDAQEALAGLVAAAPARRPPRVLVRAGERGDAKVMRHEENPAASEVHSTPLSRRAGLTRVAVNLHRIPAGRESWAFHVHHRQEEWMLVLEGRGIAEIGDAEHEVGPGDFLGFPPGGPAHHLRNPFADHLVCLVGGDAHEGVEVVDFPRIGRRKVWTDVRTTATYRLDGGCAPAPPA